jgi:hypothetical protein
VIESPVSDVERPAIAADEPDALAHESVGDRGEPPSLVASDRLQLLPESRDALALGLDPRLAVLIGAENRADELVADVCGQRSQQPLRRCDLSVDREPETESELGVVLEQRVRPSRPAAVGVLCVWSGGEVPAVDRRATRRVRNQQAVAVKLGEELDVDPKELTGFCPATGSEGGED